MMNKIHDDFFPTFSVVLLFVSAAKTIETDGHAGENEGYAYMVMIATMAVIATEAGAGVFGTIIATIGAVLVLVQPDGGINKFGAGFSYIL